MFRCERWVLTSMDWGVKRTCDAVPGKWAETGEGRETGEAGRWA